MPVAERLMRAMTEKQVSPERLAILMEGSNIRGRSARSIRNYRSNRTQPGQDFLDEAARVLGVRLVWLTAGDGPMTEGGLLVATTTLTVMAEPKVIGRRDSRQGPAATVEVVRAKVPLGDDPDVGYLLVAQFIDAWELYSRALGEDPHKASPRLLDDLIRIVRAPLASRGMRSSEEWSPREQARFYEAMLHAVKLALKDSPSARKATRN